MIKKKFKIQQLKKIKQTYKYIYIFRYNDLNINETIFIKKQIKKFNYKSLVLNQKLITNIFSNLKGQGSILIIYGNNNLNLIQEIQQLKKIELIYLVIKNNIYSKLKIKKFLINNNYLPLNNLIINPFLIFLYYLRKI